MTMPLQNLAIRGFRGATRPVEIAFENKPVIMIFSENGTGKSTIVDALDFVCNEHAGALEGRRATPVKEFLPALGSNAADLQVGLKWAGKSWTAALAGAKAKITGTTPRPAAKILRRSQILEIVDAIPSKRYEAFSRFVSVPNVEKAEGTLREAEKQTKETYAAAARNQNTARDDLRKLYNDAGQPQPNINEWAKACNNTESGDLDKRIRHIDTLTNQIKTTAGARSELTEARKQAGIDTELVQSLTNELKLAEAGNTAATSELLRVLESAESYLSAHQDDTECPVCQQGIDSTELLAQISARKTAGAQIADVSRKLEAARKKEERSQALQEKDEARFLGTAKSLAQAFHSSGLDSLKKIDIGWDRFRALLENADQLGSQPNPASPESILLAEEMLMLCAGAAGELAKERGAVSTALENLRAIKLQFANAQKYYKQAKKHEAQSKKLTFCH